MDNEAFGKTRQDVRNHFVQSKAWQGQEGGEKALYWMIKITMMLPLGGSRCCPFFISACVTVKQKS